MEMLTVYPELYHDFHCKADQCQHSCCLGWDIEIDEASAMGYQQLDTPLGREIQQRMEHRSDGYYFAMTADKRCPFLRQDGLCSMILAAGEDILCDICTMHPRFFTYLADLEFAGVGLCCEAAVELLLSKQLTFQVVAEAEAEQLWAEGLTFAELLKFLELDLGCRDFSLRPIQQENPANFILRLMEATEPIDNSWTELLRRLRENISCLGISVLDAGKQKQADNIYQYILYRQLAHLQDTEPELLLEFAQLNTWFILWCAEVTGNLPEAVRIWSAQIEYDTDNVGLMLDMLANRGLYSYND